MSELTELVVVREDALTLTGIDTKLLQNIIYNFTRRKSHDVTVKHIQVRTLVTHVVVEIRSWRCVAAW